MEKSAYRWYILVLFLARSCVWMVVIVVRGSGCKQCVWWNLKSILDQLHTAVVTQGLNVQCGSFQICIFHFQMVTAADRSAYKCQLQKLLRMIFDHPASIRNDDGQIYRNWLNIVIECLVCQNLRIKVEQIFESMRWMKTKWGGLTHNDDQ